MNIVLIAVAGILSGMLGAMGMGGGGILIIFLTLFAKMAQRSAQGVNLLLFIPCALAALCLHSKNHLIVWKTAIPAIICGLVGAAVGTFLCSLISANILRKIFGAMLLLIGLKEIFSKQKSK